MNRPKNARLALPRLPNALATAAVYIAEQQHSDGCIPWFRGQIADPWDHVEAAMGLTVGGWIDEARRAYRWLADKQNSDGSWFSEYGQRLESFHDLPDPMLKQAHHGVYLATGLWHYWLATGDKSLLFELLPTLAKAVQFVLGLQTAAGDVLWGLDSNDQVLDDSLVTACSAVYKSLASALNIADLLGCHRPQWHQAYRKLGRALRQSPERFDRSWASKQRYSMDWFYPVMSGVLQGQAATARLQQRWQEFVVPEFGCLCVNDHPWVTVAESAELCLALASAGRGDQARLMLDRLMQFQDGLDGGFWTGYVYSDEALWPEEKTTWTAAAVLLAADSTTQFTAAGNLFLHHRPE